MLYSHSIDHCFGSHGIGRGDIDALTARLAPAVEQLHTRQFPGAAAIIGIAGRDDDLPSLEALAADIRARFRHVVVAGTGGSGLSGRTLLQLVPMGASPSFYFMENIDPDMMEQTLASIDLASTCFIVISKSGATVETLSQYYVLLDHAVAKLGKEKARGHFTVITMPGSSPLRDSAQEHGLTILDHPSDIGGRYSILTSVGLLPAAIAGLDIRALRRGAQSVAAALGKAEAFAPALGAALQFAFMRKRYPMSVLLPYAERLTSFALWYRQCWAESLGKSGKGTTPIPSVGTTDQHSQLQLYLDGPRDKLFTMITLARQGKGPRIPVPPPVGGRLGGGQSCSAEQEFPLPNPPPQAGEGIKKTDDLDYIRGKTMGDVMEAEQRATLDSLTHKNCPVRLIALERLAEEEMGALLMHFMLEIMLTSFLMEVNPFDQPAVEDGKIRARDYLLKGLS